MINAPRLYTDELLSSGLVRCCRWYRVPLKRLMAVQVGGPPLRASLLAARPASLLAPLFRTLAADLLWNHTTFPYASAFCNEETYSAALAGALDWSKAHSTLFAVMQNATAGVHSRRLCPTCVRLELQRWGETFWHRSHHLPGVLVCPEHGTTLLVTNLPATGASKTYYQMPHECEVLAKPTKLPPGAHELAKRSASLLKRPFGPGEQRDASFYRAYAAARQWLSPTRQVRKDVLCQAVETLFPREFLNATGVQGARSFDWAALLFRPGSVLGHSPLKHLIVECTLEAMPPPQRQALDHAPKGPSGTDAAQLDAFYAPRARKELARVLRRKEVLTTAQFLSRVDALGPYRHRGHELPNLREVVLEFRTSSATLRPLHRGSRLFKKPSAPMHVIQGELS